MIRILGLINCVLLTFQLLTGLKIVRVPFGVHKKTGIALCCTAALHAIMALLV